MVPSNPYAATDVIWIISFARRTFLKRVPILCRNYFYLLGNFATIPRFIYPQNPITLRVMKVRISLPRTISLRAKCRIRLSDGCHRTGESRDVRNNRASLFHRSAGCILSAAAAGYCMQNKLKYLFRVASRTPTANVNAHREMP